MEPLCNNDVRPMQITRKRNSSVLPIRIISLSSYGDLLIFQLSLLREQIYLRTFSSTREQARLGLIMSSSVFA